MYRINFRYLSMFKIRNYISIDEAYMLLRYLVYRENTTYPADIDIKTAQVSINDNKRNL